MAANVLDRAFEPAVPDRAWAADMMYIATDEGWLYLSVVLDLFSRRVVGWSAPPSLSRRGPVGALAAAVRDRRPGPGLVHHSDQGSQYTSDDYRALLRRHRLVASMSRRGNCLDNAPAESFFAPLKSDLRGRRFATHAEARAALFDYIETFYNRRRRHRGGVGEGPADRGLEPGAQPEGSARDGGPGRAIGSSPLRTPASGRAGPPRTLRPCRPRATASSTSSPPGPG